MATVEVKKIGKPVTTIEYEDQVTLVMNKDEAEALCWVLGNVGGDPFETPRKHIDSIYNALCRQVKSISWPRHPSYHSIYFGDKK